MFGEIRLRSSVQAAAIPSPDFLSYTSRPDLASDISESLMSQQPNLIARCVEIFRRRHGLYTTVAALPYATLHPSLLWTSLFLTPRPAGPAQDLRAIFGAMTLSDTLEFLAIFILWITVPFAVAGRGLCRLASEQIAGRNISLREAIKEMVSFIPSGFLLGAIAGTVAVIGACFLVVPGFVAAAAFSLVVPAAAIEGIGPFAALRRGLSLMGRVFGRLLLLFFVYGFFVLATMILQGILLSAAPHIAIVRVVIFGLCTAVPLVPLALLNIALTILFLESRGSTQSVALAS